MTSHPVPDVIRRYMENSCEVTAIVVDPADTLQILYSTVTCDGTLIGSYCCADRVYQSDWRIVTADGHHLSHDGQPVNPVSAGAAVVVLTTILTDHDQREIERRLCDATRPPRW